MKKLLPIAFVASCLLPMLTQAQPIKDNAYHQVTAYVLLSQDSFGQDGYLAKLDKEVKEGTVKMDRIVFSFMEPKMNPTTVQADIKNGDLGKLLTDAGIYADATADEGQQLKTVIADLSGANVQSLFAVGGWAYSCRDPQQGATQGNQVGCTSNFPLTTDMQTAFAQAGLEKNIDDVQTAATASIKDYADAWTATAKAFGAVGVDYDYEENWFAAETTYRHPVLAAPQPSWSKNPNGPYVLPYSVIKYAVTLNALEDAASAQGMYVTTAAPAPGAFNIHSYDGQEPKGNNFWCPVADSSGNSVCGQATSGSSSANVVVSGNLKGVDYDVAHAQTLGQIGTQNDKPISYTNVDVLKNDIIGKLNSLNIMTYDLDDGYDGIGASWCIGVPQGKSVVMSRSPADNAQFSYLNDIDCSIGSQAEALVSQFKQNVIDADSVKTKPHLSFGLEAGFPNYPINISPQLPGGGNDKQSDPHYRWNDPYAVMDLPMVAEISTEAQQAVSTWASAHDKSDAPQFASVKDLHTKPLIVNQDLFSKMQAAGADGVILWSLDNDDYNDHVAKETSWDYQQLQAHNTEAFQNDYAKYGYDEKMLNLIFDNSASPEYMLKQANQFFHDGK